MPDLRRPRTGRRSIHIRAGPAVDLAARAARSGRPCGPLNGLNSAWRPVQQCSRRPVSGITHRLKLRRGAGPFTGIDETVPVPMRACVAATAPPGSRCAGRAAGTATRGSSSSDPGIRPSRAVAGGALRAPARRLGRAVRAAGLCVSEGSWGQCRARSSDPARPETGASRWFGGRRAPAPDATPGAIAPRRALGGNAGSRRSCRASVACPRRDRARPPGVERYSSCERPGRNTPARLSQQQRRAGPRLSPAARGPAAGAS